MSKNKSNVSDEQLIMAHPDKGCKWADSCLKCPYVPITIEMRCVQDYPEGIRSLVADIRSSILCSLSEKGVSVTILARVFNMSARQVYRDIDRFTKEEK